MRKRGRTDGNQAQVIRELRQAGCSVAVTSAVGDGFPDVVVGLGGVNYMVEIKSPDGPPSTRRLTPDEKAFHENWNGQICVIENTEQFFERVAAIAQFERFYEEVTDAH